MDDSIDHGMDDIYADHFIFEGDYEEREDKEYYLVQLSKESYSKESG